MLKLSCNYTSLTNSALDLEPPDDVTGRNRACGWTEALIMDPNVQPEVWSLTLVLEVTQQSFITDEVFQYFFSNVCWLKIHVFVAPLHGH